jgi:hypothetical protein
MAKLYRIKLSPKELLTDTKSVTVREIEKLALENVLSVSAINEKRIKQINEIYDIVDELRNLADTDLELKVDKAGMEYIEKGIELSAGQRTGSWFYARTMFKSVEKPEEIEV